MRLARALFIRLKSLVFRTGPCPVNPDNKLNDYNSKCGAGPRLISVEDVRNYLSHIIYILIFDFFLNFLLFVRLQTPTSSTKMLEGGIMVSERQMRFNVNL